MNRLEPIARHWRGSLLQQGWRVWLAELRACVPSWLARPEPPEQIHHWPLAVPVVSSSTRQVLMLGADAVLLQRVQLPLAAGRNLEAVVGYELDRYTPFEADQLYCVARQERRTPSHLEVTLVAILRERLDQMLTDCAALGLHPIAWTRQTSVSTCCPHRCAPVNAGRAWACSVACRGCAGPC